MKNLDLPPTEIAAGAALPGQADQVRPISVVDGCGDIRFPNTEMPKRSDDLMTAAEAGRHTLEILADLSTRLLRRWSAFREPRARFRFKSTMLLSACFMLVPGPNVRAEAILPSFYTITTGEGTAQNGTYNYFDDSSSQLIDGVYGAGNWKADLGNGHAYEWVGWRVANPVIIFHFPMLVTINTVAIDFNRTEPVALIYLPSALNIGGTDFTLAANAIPGGTRGTVNFSGLWTGTILTVTLTDNDPNHWIFVDEIKFANVAVPEPSLLVLAMGAPGFLVIRRRCRAL